MDLSFDRAPASYSLLIVIVGISVLALSVWPQIIARNLLRPYWLLKERDYGTLVTSGFIHGDYAHLFFNCLALFSMGPSLEYRIGTNKFIALYFAGLVLSGLGSVYKQRNNPDYAALGASGAIMAVVFAYIVYYPFATLLLFFVPMPAVVFALVFAGYSIWAAKAKRDNIAHEAHLDGALTGLIFVGITDFDAWRHAFRLLLG